MVDLSMAEGKRVLRIHEKEVFKKKMERKDTACFAQLTGDESRLHFDAETAAKAGFARPLVHGMYVVSLLSAMMGTTLPGNGTLYMDHEVRFIRPVFHGDVIEIAVEFISCEEREDCYIGTFRGTCRNQDGQRVLAASCRQMMKKALFEVKKDSEDGE